MPKPQKARLAREANAQAALEERRRKAAIRATRKLPSSIQRYVRDMVADMPPPDLILEMGLSVLLAQQGQFLSLYERDCQTCEANLQRAVALRAGVAHLDESDPQRQQAEAQALRYERVQPNHAGAAKVVGDLNDKIRKVTDSLAMHRPTGYTRVVFEVEEAPKAPAGNNLYAEYTSEDDDLIRRAEGDSVVEDSDA